MRCACCETSRHAAALDRRRRQDGRDRHLPRLGHHDEGAVGARARRRSRAPAAPAAPAVSVVPQRVEPRAARSCRSDSQDPALQILGLGHAEKRRMIAPGAAPLEQLHRRPASRAASPTIAPNRSGVSLPEQLQVTTMPPGLRQPQRAQVELLVGALGRAERALALGQRRRIDDHDVEACAPRPRARAAGRRRWPARRVTCEQPLRSALARARSTAGAASSSASTDVAPPRASASAKPP